MATHSPASMLNVRLRKANTAPYRFFHFLELQSDGALRRGRQGSAPDQLSQHLLGLGPFARILFFADGSGLMAQLQAEQLIL
jgi:hypothetical protein